ncbi:hypothetical protein GCM10007385_22990 [Tateyamaria omphalii]|uniref:hypothetical protein n=1 Tax=Tateyamaria omphalii TaxID=299262 RepID=UPI001677D018|nr:hypothetical protein [Tateyamaria omphalii]GGX54188.1 hypothetical protein GCM10007385_22990 [Tateyamaria omphalii]
MSFKTSALAVALSLLATSAMADLIVINGRYVVAKDSVRAYFYRQRDDRTVFDVRWSDWSTQYRCNDEYDGTRVEAASLNLVLQIGDARALDFGDFLDSEGFEGCEKF